MKQVLEGLKKGNDVRVVTTPRELTTFQAADLLHVSRPYLVRLLDEGKIPFHRVGTHRRIHLDDVLAYRAAKKAAREKALIELSRLGQEMERGE